MKRQLISFLLVLVLSLSGIAWLSAASLSAQVLNLNKTQCEAGRHLYTQFGCVERTGAAAAQYITHVYNWALIIGAILAVLMVIYGGYQYVISQGNPDATQQAKETIFYALAGLAILILAYLILRTIQPGILS